MFNSKKSHYGRLLSAVLCMFLLVIYTSLAAAADLPFDPNDFTFLVYNPLGSEARIVSAMESILGRELDEPNEIRTWSNPVTPNDLTTHNILIVGWNNGGDTSGLDDETLAAGINGRVILSGHDLDFHTVIFIDPNHQQAAETMLIQAIDWVLKGDGTGMITLGCTDAFPYLPEFWDVDEYAIGGQDVNEFTEDGLASGVYDGLEPDDMDNWDTSYHDIFTIGQDSLFVPFELGGFSGGDFITIACDKIKLPYFYIHKENNDVNCVLPGDYITYTITYGPNGVDHNNVVIIDYLPCQVDYINLSDPNYDDVNHTYKWQIGPLDANDPNDSVTLTVYVNFGVEPNGIITNYCEIKCDNYRSFAYAYTSACFWSPDIIYVDVNAVGCNSGLSWEHADPDLQSALQKAQAWDVNQIWVASGTYKPTMTSVRSISFELLDGVAIYGGFPSGGGQWANRDPNAYETILSGDITAPIDQNDNSYHVVKCVDVNNAVLDGFTITAGYANSYHPDEPNQYGGGMYCQDSNDLTISNCTFSGNWAKFGGGMFNLFESSLIVTNCTFIDNNSFLYSPDPTYGGGILNYESSPTLINCTFSGNLAFADGNSHGGAICNLDDSDPNIINCKFGGNSAIGSGNGSSYGGAIYNKNNSNPNVFNCTFSGNSATDTGNGSSYGGAICDWNDSNPNVSNCIFTANDALSCGGAIFNYYSESNINKCTFSNNSALEGGAVYNYDHSDSNISNCVLTGNKAVCYGGGMVNSFFSLPTIINCIFSGNSTVYGGAICNWYLSGPDITNCTFSNNSANEGGGIYNNDSNPNITNCILWDNVDDEIYNDGSSNPDISYSDIKGGGTGGTGNKNEYPCFFEVEPDNGSWTADPSYDESTFQSTLTNTGASWTVNQLAGKFINPDTVNQKLHFFIVSNDVNTINVWSDVESFVISGDPYQIYDYHLKVESPCIDAGYPQGDYNGQKDIDGEPRVFDGDYNDTEIVDMGADEYYWSPADFNSDGLVNFFDYALIAGAWLTTPNDVNYYDDVYDLIDNNYIDSNDLARFCEDWLWQTAWAKSFPFAYETMGRSMGKSMGESLGLTQELFPSASAKQTQPELTAAEFEEILKWLSDLWLTEDELRKMMTEEDWLKFIEQVLELAKQQIQY